MKWLIGLCAVCVLAVANCMASDWTYLGNGLYQGDNWVWEARSDCCGGWKYYKVRPADGVGYSKGSGKYDKILDFLRDREDRQEFASILDSLGIRHQQGGYGTHATGYSVLQQGFVPGLVTGGQTLYGTATYQAGMPIDVGGLIHEAQRLADRTLGVAQSANSGAAQLVSQAVEGNSKAAQIMASAQVAAAAIQAANPPTTETKVWETQSSDIPSQPTPVHFNAIGSNTDGALALLSCAQCHSGAAPKANLNLGLATIRNLSIEQRQDLAARIQERINLPANDARHMPKGRGDIPDRAKQSLLSLILADQVQESRTRISASDPRLMPGLPPVPRPGDILESNNQQPQ